MKRLAKAADPQWQDAEYRTGLLIDLMTSCDLSYKDVAEITAAAPAHVLKWRSLVVGRPIPISTLRALLYDIAATRGEHFGPWSA